MAGLCGGNIGRIGRIEAPSIQMEAEFTIACDVDTPFCGPEGAAAVFGPQKGATPESIAFLEDGMLNLRRIIIRECGIDLLEVKGSGAAGGLGGAFKAFLNARLSKGIDMVLDAIGFDQAIQDADLIITGEGKIDSQTSKGKVISGITERARKHGIPVIAIAGICDIDEEQARQLGLTAAFPTGPRPQNESDLKAAMQPETASRNISETIAKALVSLSPSLFHGNP
jgi:glycerate kinase